VNVDCDDDDDNDDDGDDGGGLKVPLEDLHSASELVVRALLIRKKYMSMCSQQFPSATERFLRHLSDDTNGTSDSNVINLAHQAGVCRPSTIIHSFILIYYKLSL